MSLKKLLSGESLKLNDVSRANWESEIEIKVHPRCTQCGQEGYIDSMGREQFDCIC